MSSRSDYRWIVENVALAIHEAQIDEHGGKPGVRDHGLLVSALARPQNAKSYKHSDAAELAALYALGVIKSHPFFDGNKRVGAVLLELFLADNGYELVAGDAQLTSVIMSLASGEASEEEFTAWVRDHTRRR